MLSLFITYLDSILQLGIFIYKLTIYSDLKWSNKTDKQPLTKNTRTERSTPISSTRELKKTCTNCVLC